MPPLLEAVGISVQFGGVRALDDVDLAFGTSGIVGIAGPNGSGKTTLLNVLSGVQRATRGRLVFDGRDYTTIAGHRMAGLGMSRTFQGVRLVVGMTVLENVMLGFHHQTSKNGVWQTWASLPSAGREERAVRAQARELLREVGLETEAERRPSELPYGLQRRVEVARALAASPRVMLLDEPTAGMARPDVRVVADLVRTVVQSRRILIVVVEHNVPLLAELCERLVIMLAGRVLVDDSPEAVLADPRVIEAYLGRRPVGVPKAGGVAK